ncbi:EAL domain-containing protein [Hyphomonas johnsonii]|uniref:Uncharacterized protein n=1 Tax=Hyphomonas johnsonii MHS-2 TaxID=1280950 RepID=A0A059FVZ2_9PROT|nr:EAL domain-containing protein [Hyphomonas johnsonii]KCZ94593.1 hypothetical protein HJO_04425 [Hyphomonas johnsonii MHS-2]
MRQVHSPLDHQSRLSPAPAFRFHQVVHLLSGDPLGQICESPVQFEERAAFGPVTGNLPDSNPAKWLSDQLVRVASATHGQSIGHRPILVPAPLAALAHSNTAVACDAAIRRTSLCQQEICLEFADAAFAGGVTDYVSRVGLLRRHGFRIAIDMRRSWQTPMNDALRLLVDTIRIDARAIDTNPDLVEIVEVADASGILIVAEHAHWRDGEYLADLGIHAASRPKADA